MKRSLHTIERRNRQRTSLIRHRREALGKQVTGTESVLKSDSFSSPVGLTVSSSPATCGTALGATTLVALFFGKYCCARQAAVTRWVSQASRGAGAAAPLGMHSSAASRSLVEAPPGVERRRRRCSSPSGATKGSTSSTGYGDCLDASRRLNCAPSSSNLPSLATFLLGGQAVCL